MVRGRPALYRLSRAIRIVAAIALVAVLLYAGVAAASAFQIRPSDVGKGATTMQVLPNGTVEIAGGINFTNPGYFPVNAITIATQVHLPNGTRLASGASPTVGVRPGATATIPLSVLLPADLLSAQSTLLTHDAKLPTDFWVNVTYASIFDAQVRVANNLSWGAPFYGLNVTVGSPTPQPNGTVTIPVRVVFDNHASFGAAGTLHYRVDAANGSTCGGGMLAVNDPPGAHVDESTVLTLTCDPSGGTLLSSFAGSPWSVTFPPEPIP